MHAGQNVFDAGKGQIHSNTWVNIKQVTSTIGVSIEFPNIEFYKDPRGLSGLCLSLGLTAGGDPLLSTPENHSTPK
jgi:hypothetical protein